MSSTKKMKKAHFRNFSKCWETKFFVAEIEGKAICLIDNCNKRSEFNTTTIKTHFNSEHSEFKKCFENVSNEESNNLKSKKYQELLTKFKQDQTEKSVIACAEGKEHKLASYKVAYLIAKNLKYNCKG